MSNDKNTPTIEKLVIDLFCYLHANEIEAIRGSLTWNSRTAFDALAEKALAVIKLVNTTHYVVAVTRSKTKKGDPMWKMTTNTDIVFFAFSSGTSATLLKDADYAPILNAMHEGDTLYWDEHPIGVMLRRKGEFWDMIDCVRRHPSAKPNTRKYPFDDKWVAGVTSAPFWVIDFETTGTDPKKDEIVEIGLCSDKGVTHSWRVRPQKPIPAEATAIHGIKTSDVAHERTFVEILPEMMAIIGTTKLVAYNAEFEKAMWDREIIWVAELVSKGLDYVPEITCAMKAYGYGMKSVSLRDACQQMGIATENYNLHSAVDDCRLTVALIEAMRKKIAGEDDPQEEANPSGIDPKRDGEPDWDVTGLDVPPSPEDMLHGDGA